MNVYRIFIGTALASIIPASIGSAQIFKDYWIHAFVTLSLVGLIQKFSGGSEVHKTLEKCLWVCAAALGLFSYFNREHPDALGPGFAIYATWMLTLMIAYWAYSPKISSRFRNRSSVCKQAPWVAAVAAMIAFEMQNGGLF